MPPSARLLAFFGPLVTCLLAGGRPPHITRFVVPFVIRAVQLPVSVPGLGYPLGSGSYVLYKGPEVVPPPLTYHNSPAPVILVPGVARIVAPRQHVVVDEVQRVRGSPSSPVGVVFPVVGRAQGLLGLNVPRPPQSLVVTPTQPLCEVGPVAPLYAASLTQGPPPE